MFENRQKLVSSNRIDLVQEKITYYMNVIVLSKVIILNYGYGKDSISLIETCEHSRLTNILLLLLYSVLLV